MTVVFSTGMWWTSWISICLGLLSRVNHCFEIPDFGNNIVHVRKTGCDFGLCESPSADYDTCDFPTAPPSLRRRALVEQDIDASETEFRHDHHPRRLLQSASLDGCNAIAVSAINVSNFNGEYRLVSDTLMFEKQTWRTDDGQSIHSVLGLSWVISGLNGTMLAHSESDPLAVSPPTTSSSWTHSQQLSSDGDYQVDLVCLDTGAPTPHPLAAPADWEQFDTCQTSAYVSDQQTTSVRIPFELQQQASVATYIQNDPYCWYPVSAFAESQCDAAYAGVPNFTLVLRFANGSAALEQLTAEIFDASPSNTPAVTCNDVMGPYYELPDDCIKRSSVVVWRNVLPGSYDIEVVVTSWHWSDPLYEASLVTECGYATRSPTTAPTPKPSSSPVATTSSNPTTSPVTASPTLVPTLSPIAPWESSTCLSVEYAASCLFGQGGLPSGIVECAAFDGNGVVELGDGDWVAPSFFADWIFDKQLLIRAQLETLPASTPTWWLTNPPWESGGANVSISRLGVWGSNAYVMFEALRLNDTYASSVTAIEATNGATVHFKDVTFAHHPYGWVFEASSASTLIFENCQFRDDGWVFEASASTLIFENCQFRDVVVQFSATESSFILVAASVFERVSPQSGTAMFGVHDSVLDIADSRFANNPCRLAVLTYSTDTGRYATGDLVITNSSFIDNQFTGSGSFIAHLVQPSASSYVKITDCAFERNSLNGGSSDLFQLSGASRFEVRSSTFADNAARYDFYMNWSVDQTRWETIYSAPPRLRIYDSRFTNGSRAVYTSQGTEYGMTMSIMAWRSTWRNYSRLVTTYGWFDGAYIDGSWEDCVFVGMTGPIMDRWTVNRDDLHFTNCLFADSDCGSNSSLFEVRGGRISFVDTNFTNNMFYRLMTVHDEAETQTDDYWVDRNSSLVMDGCVVQSDYKYGATIVAQSDLYIDIRDTDFGDHCGNSSCLKLETTDLSIDRVSVESSNTVDFSFPGTLYLAQFAEGGLDVDLDYVQTGINFTGFDGGADSKVIFTPCRSYVPSTVELPPEEGTMNFTEFGQVGQLSEQSYSCDGSSTPDGCYIKCSAKLSCVLSDITINQSATASITCSGDRSCWNNAMRIESTSAATLLCRAENACKDSKVTLMDIAEATVECMEASACGFMSLTLVNVQNVTVKCYQQHACDNLHIVSDSDNNVDLYMFRYSQNVQIALPNEFHPQHLHACIHEDAYLNLDSAGDTYLDIVVDEELAGFYPPQYLPCNESITYSFTESGRADCTTQYQFLPVPVLSKSLFPDFMECMPFFARNLYEMECIGTWAPTADPTESPTADPTVPPSALPTSTPTLGPSDSPTTAAPTEDPTFGPTDDPTVDPTSDPTRDPTADPTRDPTEDPTLDPTVDPTADPTLDPTSDPTMMPTREPTEADAYDSFFEVEYSISNWTLPAIEQFANNVSLTVAALTTMIESGYSAHASLILRYDDFWLQLLSINGRDVSEWSASGNTQRAEVAFARSRESIVFGGRVLCSELKCDHVVKDYSQALFEAFVSEQLRDYFGGMTVNAAATDAHGAFQFSVVSQSDEAMALNAEPESSAVNYGFLAALSVSGFLILIAGCAGWFNKWRYWPFKRCGGCKPVDDGRYKSIVVFALHFYDFASDINLTLEICFNLALTSSMSDSGAPRMLVLCAVSSVLFIVFPYAINVYYASRAKEMVRANETAKSWFEFHSKVFTALVVLSGGCYASLHLISSNVFGLSWLSCGLTPHELSSRKMTNIRFIGNVLFENVPQLVIQILYATYIGTVNQALVFAFIASLLSVLNHSLGYCIDLRTRDADKDIEVMYYYLIMRCEQRTSPLARNPTADLVDEEFEGAGKAPTQVAVPAMSPAFSPSSSNINVTARVKLTKEERKSITTNMGKRDALTGAMAELFGVNKRSIQIASTMLTVHGFITHVVHCVNRLEIESTPQRHINEMYRSVQSEMDDVFRAHFNLSEDFKLECQHQLTMLNRIKSVATLSKAVSSDDDEFDDEVVQEELPPNNDFDDGDAQL